MIDESFNFQYLTNINLGFQQTCGGNKSFGLQTLLIMLANLFFKCNGEITSIHVFFFELSFISLFLYWYFPSKIHYWLSPLSTVFITIHLINFSLTPRFSLKLNHSNGIFLSGSGSCFCSWLSSRAKLLEQHVQLQWGRKY